jgi:hypothetical protein
MVLIGTGTGAQKMSTNIENNSPNNNIYESLSPDISGVLHKKRGGFGKMFPNAWQHRFFTISK